MCNERVLHLPQVQLTSLRCALNPKPRHHKPYTNARVLHLSQVQLTSLRCGASVRPSEGRRIFVLPAVPSPKP